MESSQLLISVVIPAFNSEKYIKEAINSVLEQSYKNIEVIVVDDGSTDKTEQIIKSYRDVCDMRYVRQENQGPATARNTGVKSSKGEWVAFLDADDVWYQNKLASQVNVLKHNKNIFCLASTMAYTRVEKQDQPQIEDAILKNISFDDLLTNNDVGISSTVLVRREEFLQVNGFDETRKLCEDHDLWIRLSRIGPLHKIMTPLAYYREHSQGLSSGDREKTIKKHIAFINELFRDRFCEYAHKYYKRALSLAHFHNSIDYTEKQRYSMALKYLFLSIYCFPFRFPADREGMFLRIRRIFVNIFILLKLKAPFESKNNKSLEKIALMSTGLGHIKRGIETWTEDLGRELSRNGINVLVYKGAGKREKSYERVIPCLRRDNPFSKWLIKHRPGFLWRIGLATGYTLEQLTFNWNILPELLLKQYEIIHTQDPQVAEFLQKWNRRGFLKSKVILAHGTEEPFEFLAQFDYLQHLAPFHLEEARDNGVKNKKDFAIGNFIDTELMQPENSPVLRKELNIPEEAFVVLSVAAIKKTHKRIDHLIEEVATLENENVYLVVAGSKGVETEEIMELAKQKLGSRAIFLSDFPHDRIQEVYAMADIFCLCSLKDMMPIALLEALASGLPALVHHYPVEEWMIGSGGEAIDMSKKGELAKAIQKYQESSFRENKSQCARKQAVDHFSKEVILDQIYTMYEMVGAHSE